MFDLKVPNLQSKLLDCAGGPASFNVQMSRFGSPKVVSCDPMYQFSANEISQQIEKTYEAILSAARENQSNFVWKEIRSVEHLGELRVRAMRQFLEDFPTGVLEGRYRTGELPNLPFHDGEFDLALCSHFLFTYSNLLSLEFHLDSIRELCRVATEVRIFPLIGQFGAEYSPHVSVVMSRLPAEGYECKIKQVPYEFQKGGNEMLSVRREVRSGPVRKAASGQICAGSNATSKQRL
jgi:hypothetical protein